MRRRLIATLAGLTIMFLLVASATASARIRITEIQFNPAGRDTGTNAHLNKEWIVIENTGTKKRTLTGWTVHDRGRGHVYRFGSFVLRPDEYVRLHTGKGRDTGVTGCNGHCFTSYDFHWDLDEYVWNNDGDAATIVNRVGSTVDRCVYRRASNSPTRC